MTGTTVDVTPTGHGLERWAQVRAAAERLDLATLADRLGLSAGAPLVVLAAHPDDETLGLGRLMHRWARHLGPVTAVVASAGEACLDHVGPRPTGLAERRIEEWRIATAILGITRQDALGLPDGALSGCEPALVGALDVVVEELLATAERIVLACPWHRDPHPDHRAVGRATATVGRRRRLPVVEFGVWMTYWSEPAELIADGRRLALLATDEIDELAHRRACAAFVTQLEPLAADLGPVVPPSMLEHHREQLLVLPVESAQSAPETQEAATA